MPGGLVRWWPVESLRARQAGISWQGVVRTHHPFLPLIKQIQIQIQIQKQTQIHLRMGLLARRRPHSSPFPSSPICVSFLKIQKTDKKQENWHCKPLSFNSSSSSLDHPMFGALMFNVYCVLCCIASHDVSYCEPPSFILWYFIVISLSLFPTFVAAFHICGEFNFMIEMSHHRCGWDNWDMGEICCK